MTKRFYHHLTYAIVALMFGVVACIVMYKIPSIVDELSDLLDIQAVDVSFFMTIYSLVSCILAIPTYLLLKKLGPLQITVIGAFCSVIGTTIGVFGSIIDSNAYYILVVSRALEGVCYVFTSMCLPILIKNTVPNDKAGFCLSIFSLFVPIGSVLGNTFTPTLYVNSGFQITWIIYGLLMCIVTLLLIIFFKGTRTVAEASDGKKSNPASPLSISLFMVSFGLFCLMQVVLFNYFPTCLKVKFNMDSSLSGFLATLPSLIVIPFCILAGHLSDKHGTYKYVYIVSMIILTPGLAMIFCCDGILFFIGYALVCLGLAAPAVNTVAVFEMFCSKYAGLGMAIIIAACCLGQTIGSSATQFIVGNDYSNWLGVSLLIFGSGVLSIICVVFAKSQRKSLSDKK